MFVLVGAAVVGTTIGWIQAVGVLLVGGGIVLVRGLSGDADAAGLLLALAIGVSIAGYTLVDKEGVEHARVIPYFELVLVPVAIAALAWHAARGRLPRGSGRDRMDDLRRFDLRVRGVRVRACRADARLGACGGGGARDERPFRGRARSGTCSSERVDRVARSRGAAAVVVAGVVHGGAWLVVATAAAERPRFRDPPRPGSALADPGVADNRVLSSATTFHRLHEMGASRPFLLKEQRRHETQQVGDDYDVCQENGHCRTRSHPRSSCACREWRCSRSSSSRRPGSASTSTTPTGSTTRSASA